MTTQLLVYGFGPGADLEGRLVGALERIEGGGALRIRDALFVASDAESGALAAVDLRGDGAGGSLAQLLMFRLDPRERRRITERSLDGAAGPTLRSLGASLAPGCAIAAILVEHVWAQALEDAVSRSAGARLLDERIDAASLADCAGPLLAAAERAGAASR
jgi:hypothetical protein